MLDQILALVRESGQQSVVENPAVPNEQNEAVMHETSSSIFNGLRDMMQNGGPSTLTGLFTGVQSGSASHPGVQHFTGQVSNNLSEKFGLDSNVTQNIAGSILPVVLGKMMNSGGSGSGGAGRSGGFNITDLLSSFTGGGGAPGGTMENISNMGTKIGLDRDGDGDTDLNDLLRLFNR